MELRELQKHWEAFGKTDPLWAILSLPDRRHGRWDLAEFFELGRVQVEDLMENIKTRQIPVRTGTALDFGCGVGRLTQALAAFFEACHGVDIAPSMIEQARRLNRHGDRCRYFLNEVDDLTLFNDNMFDLIYSSIVLQHMKPEYALKYIKEFFRVLAPGGVAVFQLPSEPAPIERRVGLGRTARDTPLPNSAFRARLTPIDAPSALPAGSEVLLRVAVKNESDTNWPALGTFEGRYFTALVNRWLDEHQQPVETNDRRVYLSEDIEPGVETEIVISITAPHEPGRYELELDMSDEAFCWFQEKGSRPTRLTIDVHEAEARQPDPFSPTIEVFTVKRPDVVALVEASGGEVLAIQPIDEGTNPLLDYNYYVRKPERATLWARLDRWRRRPFARIRRAAG